MFPISTIEGIVVDTDRNPLSKITVEVLTENRGGQRSLSSSVRSVTTGDDGFGE